MIESVKPYDDETICGTDYLIRRVSPIQHIVEDDKGNRRISTKLFSPSSGKNGGMSVDIRKLIEGDGVDVRSFVTTPIYTASVQFAVGCARDAGLMVGATPKKENPYHGDVWRSGNGSNKFTGKQKKALQNGSQWLVEIKGVSIA